MWRAVRTLWRAAVLFLVCTVVAPGVVGVTVLATFILLPLPATPLIAKPIEASQASIVTDAEGNQIAEFRVYDQNIPISRDQIPKVLKQAVVAAEDARFYQHSGVDLRGTARALVRDIQGGGGLQGGSTLTQQYVKNTYTGADRTIIRKVKEAILASQLDRQIDKDEILYRYLSIIFMGEGAYGVGAAAQTYFRKDISQLTASEAAALAGVIPAPSRYSLRDHPDAAEGKRLIVLRKMFDQGYLAQVAYDAAVAAPLTITATPLDPATATSVYPTEQRNTKYPYFVDYVHRYLVSKYGADVVDRGGLAIQTTLDQNLQQQAERITGDAIKGVKPLKSDNGKLDPIIMGLVSVEPGTGYVKALVGGQDFGDPTIGNVNLALGRCIAKPSAPVNVSATCWDEKAPVEGGGAGRQPGSSWKPMALAAAFEKGIPPTKVYSAPKVFTIKGCKSAKCTISNAADGEGGGSMTLAQATTFSVNTVFAGLAQDIGIESIGAMAKKLGVDQAWVRTPGTHGLSYVLGVQEVSPLEMAAAYSVWANRGLRNPATPIFKVRDKSGKVIEDNSTPKNMRVLDEAVADNMNQVLQGPLQSGTARGKNLDRPAAGKTGTTDDYTSAWFVGYTPALSTAVFMGYASPYLDAKGAKPASMVNVKGVSRVFGGTIPAQTWQTYMTAALKTVPPTDFSQPAPIQKIQDELDKARRGGIDAGARRDVVGTSDGGPFVVGPATPKAPAPAGPASAPPTTGPNGTDPVTTTTTRRLGGIVPGPPTAP